MKVLIISAAFPPMPSGESTNAYHMAEQLAAQGLEVHVLTSIGNSAAPGRIKVHPIMRRWSWSEVPRLVSFLRWCSPDVIYLMYLGWTYNFQFMSTFIATIAKRVLPTVTFITRFENIGGAGPIPNSMASRAIRKIIATCSARDATDYEFGTLLSDSDALVLLSARHVPVLETRRHGVTSKCVLIPPPANMALSADEPASRAEGRRLLGIADDEFLLTYIGFIYPGKGIETLLRAFKQLSDAAPKLRLAIMGGSLGREFPDRPSYAEEMKALATTLEINHRILWTGSYDSSSPHASLCLRATDICVFPFDTGVKLNNSSFSSAAAHGVPIITSLDDALEPQFVHGENVFLCAPQSPEAIVNAVQVLMSDDSLRRKLAAGSRRFAREWYSWDTAVRRTLQLFGHGQERGGQGQTSQWAGA